MTEREEKAKAWLNRNYSTAMEIDAIKRRLERLNSDLEKVTRPLKIKEVIEANNPGNSQEDRLVEYISLSDDLSKRIVELMEKDAETINVINRVDGSVLRTILIERYVNRLSWRDVAKRCHYEERRIYDYHLQALDAVLPFIPEEVKHE